MYGPRGPALCPRGDKKQIPPQVALREDLERITVTSKRGFRVTSPTPPVLTPIQFDQSRSCRATCKCRIPRSVDGVNPRRTDHRQYSFPPSGGSPRQGVSPPGGSGATTVPRQRDSPHPRRSVADPRRTAPVGRPPARSGGSTNNPPARHRGARRGRPRAPVLADPRKASLQNYTFC